MKEKIKKIFDRLFKIAIKIAEIGTIIWAVNGMLSPFRWYHYSISAVLGYFLSAILILYLLRKYEPKT
jgi:hypothetical protein